MNMLKNQAKVIKFVNNHKLYFINLCFLKHFQLRPNIHSFIFRVCNTIINASIKCVMIKSRRKHFHFLKHQSFLFLIHLCSSNCFDYVTDYCSPLCHSKPELIAAKLCFHFPYLIYFFCHYQSPSTPFYKINFLDE